MTHEPAPLLLPIAADCRFDAASILLFDVLEHEGTHYATLSDRTLATHWGESDERGRTLVVEQLPLSIAETLSEGIESYFEHLVFARFSTNEHGFAREVTTSRFGETGDGDVLRRAAVVMAALEATGVVAP